MKILVTGAVGFIGSHTAERLQKIGHEVIGVDNFNDYYSLELKQLNENALKEKGISVLKLDLRQPSDVDQLPKTLIISFILRHNLEFLQHLLLKIILQIMLWQPKI